MMKFSTAVAGAMIIGVLAMFAGAAGAQQAYPSKPIRLIVPYAAGGLVDVVGRLLGQKLSASVGQNVIVDNRAGGNTVIGSEAMVKAPPDGYTILLVSSAHAINPALSHTPYDPIKDFAPVASVMSAEQLFVLNPAVPANNLREFIALAKARDGKLNYATSGSGSPGNLQGELFKIMAGVKIQHIPFNGSTPALNSVIGGGQVEMSIQSPASAIQHVATGRLKAIAITGEKRSAAFPQVATLTESGLPNADVKNWQGILAPVGTPRPVIDRLSAEFAKILAMPDIKAKFAAETLDPLIMTPEQFGAMLRSEVDKFAKLVKTANIKSE